MKENIFTINSKLQNGEITTEQARNKLLDLFGVSNILNFDIEKGDRVFYQKIETNVEEVITEGKWSGRYRIRTSGNSSAVVEKHEIRLTYRKI